MRRLLPLLSLLFTLLLAVPALAHASLLTSEPTDGSVVATAPSTFTLTFNEPVSPTVLSLIEPGGQAVPLDHPHLADDVVSVPMPPALADGSYALSWRVISADGHPIGGSVVFSIGAPSTANQPQVAPTFDPVVRAGIWLSKLLVYGGLFVGIGGVFARRWLGIAKAGRATEFALLAGTLGLLPNVGFEGADALGRPANALLDLAAWSEGLVGSHGIFVGPPCLRSCWPLSPPEPALLAAASCRCWPSSHSERLLPPPATPARPIRNGLPGRRSSSTP